MSSKKLLFLAAGYIAGNVVSSLYTQKKGKDLQADIKKASKDGNEAEIVVSSFVDTQKKLFQDLQGLIPKEHKKTFDGKKKEVLKLWGKLKTEGEKLLKKMEDETKK